MGTGPGFRASHSRILIATRGRRRTRTKEYVEMGVAMIGCRGLGGFQPQGSELLTEVAVLRMELGAVPTKLTQLRPTTRREVVPLVGTQTNKPHRLT